IDLPGVKTKSLLRVKENNTKSSPRAPSPTKRKDRSDEKSKDRATKESSEKDHGRDKARKRRSASSGSPSTGARSSSTSSSGSSPSTGSSSSSASSRSGSSSTSRSSSSSSSPGSPSPSRHGHDNQRRSCSKSKPPKRDGKERKRQSPSPKPTEVHIGRLTRNVTKDHIMEIFSTYGKIKMIDMPVERVHPHLSKGYAYVEFENPDEVEKALKHMDGGQVDGQELTATAVLAPWPRPPPWRFSPPRRMLPPPPMWHRSPPRMRRRSRSPRRKVRSRSRSPWLVLSALWDIPCPCGLSVAPWQIALSAPHQHPSQNRVGSMRVGLLIYQEPLSREEGDARI
uniref:RNA-binding protein with serine-rich domain 1 n=1 Tax=Jaculus jaculus TaxID=51337 RepID=A0A8C5L032_JACJA